MSKDCDDCTQNEIFIEELSGHTKTKTTNTGNRTNRKQAYLLTPYCEQHLNRTVKLEREIAILNERFSDLSDIKNAIRSIETYITKSTVSFSNFENKLNELSNSIANTKKETEQRIDNSEAHNVPRIEKSIQQFVDKFDEHREKNDDKINRIENALIQNETKSKVIYGILAAIGTGTLAVFIKLLLA
jgi:predicted ribosome quality control (RQC) complex YloA/Tae2 family protein